MSLAEARKRGCSADADALHLRAAIHEIRFGRVDMLILCNLPEGAALLECVRTNPRALLASWEHTPVVVSPTFLALLYLSVVTALEDGLWQVFRLMA